MQDNSRSRDGDEDATFQVLLQAAKGRNLGHLLLRTSRLLNETALRRLQAPSPQEVRPAHTQLFPHIDLDGTRQTELAARVGISKQAVGQLVQDLERMGILERVPDPQDGRAHLIRFSAEGRKGLLTGLAHLARLEAELARTLTPARVERLKDDLSALLHALEAADTDKA